MNNKTSRIIFVLEVRRSDDDCIPKLDSSSCDFWDGFGGQFLKGMRVDIEGRWIDQGLAEQM